MKCRDIDQRLLDGDLAVPFPNDVEVHVSECRGCQRLIRAIGAPIAAIQPAPGTLRRIESVITSDLKRVRPLASEHTMIATLIAAFEILVTIGIFQTGALAFSAMSRLQNGVILGALAISAGLLTSSFVRQMVPGSNQLINPGDLSIGLIVLLTTCVAALFPFDFEGDFWAQALPCVKTGVPLAAIAAVFLGLVLRRGAFLSPTSTGVGAGLLAGLVGTIELQLRCADLNAWHILTSHLGLGVFGSGLGGAIGLAFEASSRRRRA